VNCLKRLWKWILAKLTLTDITAGYDTASINAANNALVEAALENTLSRDGTSPNQMEANLDMNSYRIQNLPEGVAPTEPITVSQYSVGATKAYVDAQAFGGVAVLDGWVNVKDHGATGDGVTDDRAAIISALAAAVALGGGVVFFPPGSYLVSQYVHVNAVDNITFLGSKGSKLLFPSSDTGVTAGTTGSTARARSFFYCEDSDDLTFRDLYFVGDDTETDISVNVGKGIYLNNCKNVSILNCRSDYGGGLFLQNAFANDLGLKVIGNTIYASRNACVSGSDAMIVGNYFEVPDSVGYDRIGSDGSSHCLYFYAGRHNINISNNVFKN
jgi:hypothetical protein